MSEPGVYGVESIVVLEALEAVRARPGMYVGDLHDGRGLMHLVWNLVDDALVRTREPRKLSVEVTLQADGSVTVRDDATPEGIGRDPVTGETRMEQWLTQLVAGRWRWASPVNALSAWLEVEVCEGGARFRQRYARGRALSPVTRAGTSDREGTTLHFFPDPQVFTGVARMPFYPLVGRLRPLAACDARLSLRLEDRASGASAGIHYARGLRSLVEEIVGGDPRLAGPLFHSVHAFSCRCGCPQPERRMEVAAMFHESGTRRSFGYVRHRPLDVGNPPRVDAWFTAALAEATSRAAERAGVPCGSGRPWRDALRAVPLTLVACVESIDSVTQRLPLAEAVPALETFLLEQPALLHRLARAASSR